MKSKEIGRTKKFIYSSFATALYQIIIMFSGFLVPRFMLVSYGSELNGLVSSITQFITYFSLVEAGIAAAAVYSLYQPLAENNIGKVNGIVSATKKYYYQAGWMFTALVCGMAIIYPFFKKVEDLSSIMVMILVVALGARTFFDFFTLAKYRVFLTANQKVYIISMASIVYQVAYTLIVIVLSVLKVNIVLVYIAAIIAIYLRTFILQIYVKNHYPDIRFDAVPERDALVKRWDALYLQFLGAAQNGVPIIIATIFETLSKVSVFSIYNMIVTGINGVMSIFTSGLSASFGDIIARKEQNTLEQSYSEFMFAYAVINTFIYSVASLMIVEFVKLYTQDINDENYIMPMLAFFIVLNGFFYNMKTPQGMMIGSAGHYKETRVQSTIQAMIIIILGIILAIKYSLVGIVMASCVSNIYRDIDLAIYIPRNITHTKVFETAKSMGWSVINFFIILLVGKLISFSADTVKLWIIKGCLESVLAVLVLFVSSVFFYRKELENTIKLMCSLFKKN